MSNSKLAWVTAALSAVLMPSAFAALPPQFQNANDLDLLVYYVKEHAAVAAGITSIDMQKFVIHFDKDCSVQFEREVPQNPIPGPAKILTFKSANCPVD